MGLITCPTRQSKKELLSHLRSRRTIRRSERVDPNFLTSAMPASPTPEQRRALAAYDHDFGFRLSTARLTSPATRTASMTAPMTYSVFMRCVTLRCERRTSNCSAYLHDRRRVPSLQPGAHDMLLRHMNSRWMGQDLHRKYVSPAFVEGVLGARWPFLKTLQARVTSVSRPVPGRRYRRDWRRTDSRRSPCSIF